MPNPTQTEAAEMEKAAQEYVTKNHLYGVTAGAFVVARGLAEFALSRERDAVRRCAEIVQDVRNNPYASNETDSIELEIKRAYSQHFKED